MKKKYYTDYLVANSFKIGLGSIFNLEGNYFDYNYASSDKEADFIALLNDWLVVGQDIENSIEILEVEIEREKQLSIPFEV